MFFNTDHVEGSQTAADTRILAIGGAIGQRTRTPGYPRLLKNLAQP
jgi:hypothetical protein